MEYLKKYKNIAVFLAIFLAAFYAYRFITGNFRSSSTPAVQTVVNVSTELSPDATIAEKFVERLQRLRAVQIDKANQAVFSKKLFSDLREHQPLTISADQTERRKNNPFVGVPVKETVIPEELVEPSTPSGTAIPASLRRVQ